MKSILNSAASLTAICIFFPQAALAQDAGSAAVSDNYDVNTIIVTAQKRAQSINDVGLAITALSGDILRDRQINSLSDLSQIVPGLQFTTSGSNTPVYTLRGIGFYETTLGAYPSVSVYLDEAPLPFPVLSTNTAFDLERVEVLKGPQGTLFGNNSTGGAVNYIAAKPTDSLEAGGSIGYGRFETFQGEMFVSGPLSDKVKVRLAGKAVHSGDWQRGYTIPDTNGKTEVYAGRMLIDFEPSDRLKFQFNLNGWVDKSDPQAPQYSEFRRNFPGAPTPVEFYPLAPKTPRAADFTTALDPHADNKFWQAIFRGDLELSDSIALTSLTAYFRYNQDMAFDGDGVALEDFDIGNFGGKARGFSQELRLSNSAADAVRWTIGANYSRDTASDDYTLLYRDSSILTGSGVGESGFRSSQKMKNYAAFASVEADVGEFTFKAGGRYTEAKRSASSCFYVNADNPFLANFQGIYQFLSDSLRAQNGLPAAGPIPSDGCYTINTTGILGNPPDYRPGEFLGRLNENSFSFRAGVDWKPSRNTLAYLNVAKGYKAGSFPSAGAATFDQLKGVKQESLMTYEAGVKATALRGALQVNASAFYYDYKDKQLRSKLVDPIFGLLDALVNIPRSEVKGAELEVTAYPTEGLMLYGNFAYIDSKIKRFVGYSGAGVFADFRGSAFPYAPKYSLNGGFQYDFPASEGLKMFVGGDVTVRSDTTAIIGDAPGYEIEDYTLLDVRAGIEDADERWKLTVWGKNITNEYYWNNVANYYDTLARFTGRPATYGVTLAFRLR